MPASYQGTQFRTSGAPIIDLAPPAGKSTARQRDELELLGRLNRVHLERKPGESELAARLATYELAFRMQSEAPQAVENKVHVHDFHATILHLLGIILIWLRPKAGLGFICVPSVA